MENLFYILDQRLNIHRYGLNTEPSTTLGGKPPPHWYVSLCAGWKCYLNILKFRNNISSYYLYRNLVF